MALCAGCHGADRGYIARLPGGVAEWLKAHAWKACIRETVSWVRIPLPPPEQLSATIRPHPLPSSNLLEIIIFCANIGSELFKVARGNSDVTCGASHGIWRTLHLGGQVSVKLIRRSRNGVVSVTDTLGWGNRSWRKMSSGSVQWR
jgi:hypothetical protein